MLRFVEVGTVGFSAPLIVLGTPAVRDRFDSVSAGPSAYPVMGPNAAGSYCLTDAFLIAEKSRLLPIPNSPVYVVEPALVKPA